jgi:uncharacterized protein (DUF2342 family)
MDHYKPLRVELLEIGGIPSALTAMRLPMEGRKRRSKDKDLAMKLVKLGNEHGKFQRGIEVWCRIHMQAGFMIEFDTYRIGIDTLSTSSSMHNELRYLQSDELAEEKQKTLVDKVYTRIAKISYQTLRRIYIQRRKHKHPDWQIFCNWIETLPEFDWLIMPELIKKNNKG